MLLNAQGSELAGYRDELIDNFTEIGIEYVELFRKSHPEACNSISRFFIHNATAWWVSILQEIVMHDMQADELKQFITEYVDFWMAGWRKLIGI